MYPDDVPPFRLSEYTALQSALNPRERRSFPFFSDWLEDRVRYLSSTGQSPSEDLKTMSRRPSPIVHHHQSMWAYGYHFRAEDNSGGTNVSYDSGVAAIISQTCRSSRADRHPVEAELLYVGVVQDILKVDYGHITHNVLRCSWIKPHLEGVRTIREDIDGFWSVKFNARQPANAEPYLMPAHARQVLSIIHWNVHGYHRLWELSSHRQVIVRHVSR